MFTGLVQATAPMVSLEGGVLKIIDPQAWPEEEWRVGESISVSGCCLSLVSWEEMTLTFNVTAETLSRTALGQKKAGDLVNLERAMRPHDRLGGHIVQGHVDRIGYLVAIEEDDVFLFDAGQGSEAWLLEKGSICVDGISLTMVRPAGTQFRVALIPITLEETSLRDAEEGDIVNIEFDMMLKHSAHLHSLRQE